MLLYKCYILVTVFISKGFAFGGELVGTFSSLLYSGISLSFFQYLGPKISHFCWRPFSSYFCFPNGVSLPYIFSIWVLKLKMSVFSVSFFCLHKLIIFSISYFLPPIYFEYLCPKTLLHISTSPVVSPSPIYFEYYKI